MPRLPIVGSDDGTWGTYLNEFLEVSLDNTNVDLAERGKLKSAAVDAAGAVMNSDTSTATMSFVVDEDNMASNSATKVPTQQSVKAYVDTGTATVTGKSISLTSNTLTGTTAQFNTALTDNDFATIAGTETLTSKTLTSPVLNTGVSGTAIVDEDDMVSNSATKIPTQQSTKAYVDNNLATPSIEKAFTLKSDGFTAIRTAINDSKNTAYDLVILADSLPMHTFNAPGWTWQLGDKFARAARHVNPTKEVYYARPYYSSNIGHYKMDYCEGSDNLSVTARGGATLSNGQVAYHTAVCDGWTVGYTAGTGSLVVRDGGPSGTILTTIDTSLVSGSGNLWTSNALTYQSNQIHITSTGDTVLDFVRPYVGNRTSGVRVWTVSRTGQTSSQFSATPAYGLNFINKLQPDFVLICTGTNDTGSTPVTTLIADILTNAPSATVYGWVPPVGGAFTQAEADAIRAAYDAAGVAKIDMDKLLPDWQTELTRDGVHPLASTTRLMADLVWGVMTGDKEAEKMRSGIDNFVNSLDILGTYNRDIRLLSARQASEEGFTGKPTIQLNDGATNTVTLSATSTTLNVTGSETVSGTLTASANAVINGTISGTAIVDEDNMSSNSATKVPTQQSVKAYVDTADALKAPIANPTFTGQVTLPNQFTYSNGNLVAGNVFGAPTFYLKDTADTLGQVNFGTSAINNIFSSFSQPSLSLGTGSAAPDTVLARNDVGEIRMRTATVGQTGNIIFAKKFNNQTGTSYTLAITDEGKIVTTNNAAANTLSLPQDSAAAFTIGAEIPIINYGDGVTTIQAGTGATLVGNGVLAKNERKVATKVATSTWHVSNASADVLVDEDNMVSDLATKSPTQQSTKAYVDDAVTVTEMPGALPYRSKYLDNWLAKLKDSNDAGPLNIVIVGDSIASGSSTDSPTARGWGWILSDIFARKDYLSRYPDTPAVTQVEPDGWTPALADWGKTMTSCQGTATATGLGRYSSTMSSGQVAYHTATLDAVSVVYNMSPTGGQIEVRDGPGGTLLTTIETNGTAVGSQMWTSSALTYGSHTIHLTAVCGGGESVVLNGVYCYSGNLTRGIRVWPAARATINTDLARTDTTFFLDFIDTIDPDLVVLATGANDSAANYTSRMQSLIDDTRARTSADIALWGCYPITRLAKYLESQSVLARNMALSNNLQIIDAFLALPDMRQGLYFRDNLHPNDKGVKILAWHAYSVLSGDPLGFTMRELSTKAEQSSLDTLTTTVNTKAPIASPTFTGTVTGNLSGNVTGNLTGNVTGALDLSNGANGALKIVSFYGYPAVLLYNNAADANGAIAFFGAPLASLIGYSSTAAIVFGAGGGSAVDAGLARTGASEMTFYGTSSASKSTVNVADPTSASHAATKGYVDSGTITMTNKTLTSPVINTGVSGTAILDEDNMASNSATQLATQQSIKAYVDSRNQTLMANNGGSAISNTATETTVQTGVITITAGTLQDGDTIELEYAGNHLNNSGGSINHTTKLKFNNTAIFSSTYTHVTSAFAIRYAHDFKATRMSSTTLLLTGKIYLSNTVNTAVVKYQVVQGTECTVTVSDMDSNNLDIDMTFQWASAHASATTTPYAVRAQLMKG
ncbi:MAG TPA: SGNH/GDSL hydrolase family protein [Candidatus Saccharibacteria bacterium]|nr:SGNH/GDSL hydrolase family protein [Candidatus Saccharibacteria bacterium]